jgi:hypothetical protein
MPSASCYNSDHGRSSTALVEAPPPQPSEAINSRECEAASGARRRVVRATWRRPLPLLLAAGGGNRGAGRCAAARGIKALTTAVALSYYMVEHRFDCATCQTATSRCRLSS